MKRAISNIAIALAALLGALAFGEIILRQVVTLPLERIEPEIRYVDHPVRRFTLAPDQAGFTYGAPARIDARGFRVNGTSRREDGTTRRILGLGDSYTFGLGVADGETWPARLESHLRRHATVPVSVINAGTISYGVAQQLDLLRSDALRTGPDVVVHALYWNDYMGPGLPRDGARSVLTPEGYLSWEHPPQPSDPVRRLGASLMTRSAFLFAIRETLARSRSRTASGYGPAYHSLLEAGLGEPHWDTIETFYRELQALAAESGFAIFVVIMPVIGILATEAPHEHPYPAEARRRLERLGIPYLDTFQLAAERALGERHFLPQRFDSHLNASGYDIVAERLAARLRSEPRVAAALGLSPAAP